MDRYNMKIPNKYLELYMRQGQYNMQNMHNTQIQEKLEKLWIPYANKHKEISKIIFKKWQKRVKYNEISK